MGELNALTRISTLLSLQTECIVQRLIIDLPIKTCPHHNQSRLFAGHCAE